jgi:hypothetical protein
MITIEGFVAEQLSTWEVPTAPDGSVGALEVPFEETLGPIRFERCVLEHDSPGEV